MRATARLPCPTYSAAKPALLPVPIKVPIGEVPTGEKSFASRRTTIQPLASWTKRVWTLCWWATRSAWSCSATKIGFRVQGKTMEAAQQLLRDARAVEAAGAFSIVLESIPRELAARITSELRIPTIGIGAGPECDGQILVLHDMIGLSLGHTPKFARRYANVGEAISHAVAAYAEDVREGRFPADEESYHLSSEVRERLLAIRRS